MEVKSLKKNKYLESTSIVYNRIRFSDIYNIKVLYLNN